MLSILLFTFSLSIDSFLMSISYGIHKIKIPISSNFLLSFISTFMLGISFLSANLLKNGCNNTFCTILSFLILFGLGIYRILETPIKHFVAKRKFHHSFIRIYSDEKTADFDHSNHLSIKEAWVLGITLSLDSLASGIGIGLTTSSYSLFLLFTFLWSVLMIFLGTKLGKFLSYRSYWNWLSGCLLIFLAFTRFF